MKITKSQIKNIIFLVVIALLIIPQTRQPIQVLLHKGLAVFSPSTVNESKQITITNYNWKLKDENSHILNFEEVRGKVVLVNFWATWCPPCIAEMPSMQKLYDDYSNKIEFVFVSNEDYSKTNQFLNKNNYTFKTFTPITNYPDTFDVSSIPRTFLIDKSGRIVIDKTGAANWNSETVRNTIDELLK
ncbi:TlpA family protein disulfide reductase [Flaviramulus sp. BrNp1-15]|uniref:TlpA family protein disulfide reductase n=1 Tax=Flaviramulus sp. BrNp1-15 TaxID=2916754 RepID=UPI001EE951AA|nr:TlpA disulfide reductase family protein [Flaviramulus sp. BrNp1-15]ULC58690.1 TlpA family protein disulfide reductase [Flaviramulus sp. BrNp1-15]